MVSLFPSFRTILEKDYRCLRVVRVLFDSCSGWVKDKEVFVLKSLTGSGALVACLAACRIGEWDFVVSSKSRK